MNKNNLLQFLIAGLILINSGCKNSKKEEAETSIVKTPVEIEFARKDKIEEANYLPAVSAYLRKEVLRASTSGYVYEVRKTLGEKVSAGELIMTIKTKEASILKSVQVDSTLKLNGLIQLKANSEGIISQFEHHQGDFVSEGDPLLTIAQPGSLVFYLKVPYSEHGQVQKGEIYTLLLPDGKKMTGKIVRQMSTVDQGSQSEDYLLEPSGREEIPENLWAQVPIIISSKKGSIALPKTCLQSNESQTEYWVMKLANDSLAIKVNVSKGIETDSLVEILSPVFLENDRFASKGSYGLPDTARIEIIKKP